MIKYFWARLELFKVGQQEKTLSQVTIVVLLKVGQSKKTLTKVSAGKVWPMAEEFQQG